MATELTSARFSRAVAAERADLERQRARLLHEARELRASLARIEDGLEAIDERCRLLDRLAPDAAPVARERRGAGAGAVPGLPDGAPATARRELLRGPAIRDAAVAVLLAGGRDVLHYREWFERVRRAGHEIAGKDPLAVFLTQLSRAPAVRKSGRAGVYALDRQAPQRLARKLEDLQRELAALPVATARDLAVVRERRTRLTVEIRRAERALEEVLRQLGDAG